jgi:hypothetical protein
MCQNYCNQGKHVDKICQWGFETIKYIHWIVRFWELCIQLRHEELDLKKSPSILNNLEHQGKVWCNCYSNNYKTKINYQLKNYVKDMKLVVINLKCELDDIFLVEGATMFKDIFKVRFPLSFPQDKMWGVTISLSTSFSLI